MFPSLRPINVVVVVIGVRALRLYDIVATLDSTPAPR